MNYVNIYKFVILLSILLVSCFVNPFSLEFEFLCLSGVRLFFFNLSNLIFFILISVIEDKNLEQYLLFILVWVGSLVVISFNHLLIIFLGLELQTFSSLILISKNRSSIKGSEAGLKYFILGALSSGLYLLGVYMFFINNISLKVDNIFLFSNSNILLYGYIIILVSLLFKIALTPFHFWIPDIYEGSSWIVIGLLSSLPKISILCFLYYILLFNIDIILCCSLLSVIIGTIGALNQSKLKRLLGYSSISHMGFITLGYSIGVSYGYEISMVYLIIYMIMTLTIIILILNSLINNEEYIINLSGVQLKNKLLAMTWLLSFLSIAGIPPLSGFIGKWFVIWNVLNFDYLYSSLILIVFSIIGLAYYLKVIQVVYFQKKSSYFIWNSILSKNYSLRIKNNLIFLGVGVFLTLALILNLNPIILFLDFIVSY